MKPKPSNSFLIVGQPRPTFTPAPDALPALAATPNGAQKSVGNPCFLGGVFPGHGANSSPAHGKKAKGRYTRSDFQRYAQR